MRLTGTPPAALINRMPSHEVRTTHTLLSWQRTGGGSRKMFAAQLSYQHSAFYHNTIAQKYTFTVSVCAVLMLQETVWNTLFLGG